MATPILNYETPADGSLHGDKRLRVGTLQYTKAGLAWLFVWLLWGDFVFTLMEAVTPSILPLRLKELKAPDWVLPMILTTLPSTINFLLNPVISTASDRHRGRLGRRIPFLLIGTFLVTVSLVLLAYADTIGSALHVRLGDYAPSTAWGWGAVLIGTLAVFYAFFKISDMFINTVFWYFFNDVVPQAYMARFLGLFRTVGSLVGMLYNQFIFKHALTHTRWIFLGAAIIYGSGFLLMCLFVREGKYPPPKPVGRNPLTLIGTYFRECMSHRVYLYYFLQHLFWIGSHAAGVFFVFLKLSLGLNLAQIGTLTAISSGAQMIANYPAGMLADRFHPLRVLVWMKVGLVVIVPLNFIWLFGNFTPRAVFVIFIFLFAFELPLGTLYSAVLLPTGMRLYPKSHFGQFCSFNAMLTAIMQIVASALVGFFMLYMRHLFPDAVYGKDYCYRLFPLWRLPFLALSLTFLFLLYHQWKRLGGEKDYHPPGFEAEAVPLAGAAAVAAAAVQTQPANSQADVPAEEE